MNSEVAEEAIVECWDAVSDWPIAVEWAGSMAIDSSVKVVAREPVDGLWMYKFILVDDPLRLSGPCIEEDDEGGTTGLRPSSAS
jgi:hypothetical protein